MNAYSELSREELIAKINELEDIISVYKEEKDAQETLAFPWIGNLGHYYFFIKENRVICNAQKTMVLGYKGDDVPEKITSEFFTSKLHPEDYERVMENMRQHLRGIDPAFEGTYRIQARDGSWKWFYDRGKLTKWDKEGKPEMVAGIVFDVTEQKRMEVMLAHQNEQLMEASKIDFLTDVYNRRGLHEKLDYETRRANRNKFPLSVLILDVDHFKHINDTFGHLIGDDVLIQIAEIIKKSVRNTDIVGRYGGEEFLVLLPECNLEGAVQIGEKIRLAVENEEFSSGIRATISGGAQQYSSGSVDRLIDTADHALYEAKRNGRNQIRSFSAGI